MLLQHPGDWTAAKYFYMHDRLGSVRLVFESVWDTASSQYKPVVRNLYTYDAYGKRLGEGADTIETVYNPFQFTGQWYDAEIGQYYLRARQYDPQLLRFTSRDPVFGGYEDPMSLHAYLYCWNNPINMVDPSGELLEEPLETISFGARIYQAADYSRTIGRRAMQILAGASIQNVLVGAAIDVFSDMAMGKGLGFLGDAVGPALKKLTPVLQRGGGHHLLPKWLGGATKQFLYKWDDALSAETHRELESAIRKRMRNKIGVQVGGKGGGMNDIDEFFKRNPDKQAEAFQELLGIYKEFYETKGTSLVKGFILSISK